MIEFHAANFLRTRIFNDSIEYGVPLKIKDSGLIIYQIGDRSYTTHFVLTDLYHIQRHD